MKHSENHMKLEKALIRTYQGKEKTDPGDLWETKVMARIRSLGPPHAEPDCFSLLDQFVWRFSAAACLLVLVLSLYAFQTGMQPEYELANLFTDNSLESAFVQYFGI